MSYHRIGSGSPFLSPSGLGATAAPTAGLANAVCLKWARDNYDFAGFDSARAALLAWSRAAPSPPWTNGLGQPTAPPGNMVTSRGWTGAANDAWAQYCVDAAAWCLDATRRMRDLAAKINLPMSWLFASDPASVEAHNEVVAPASWDFYANVGTTIPVNFPGIVPRAWQQPEGRAWQTTIANKATQPSELVKLPVSTLDATVDIPGGGYAKNAGGLAAFWRDFKYINWPRVKRGGRSDYYATPLGRDGQHPLGFPPELGVYAIPPAVWTCSRVSASIFGGGAESGESCRGPWAGPAVTVAAIQQIIATATSRPALAVLANAFQTWGRILVVWSDAPGNRMPADDMRVIRAAGRAMSGIGDAMFATGLATSNPYTFIAAVALEVVGRLAALMHGAVGSTACYMEGGTYRILGFGDKPRPSRFTGGLRNYKSMGNLCAPATPLLVKPPDGCAPGSALDLVKHDTPWKLPSWLKWLGLALGGTALAYGGYKLAAGRSSNPRRRNGTFGPRVEAALRDLATRDPWAKGTTVYRVALDAGASDAWARQMAKNVFDEFVVAAMPRRRRNAFKLRPGQRIERPGGEVFKACNVCASLMGPFASRADAERHSDACDRCEGLVAPEMDLDAPTQRAPAMFTSNRRRRTRRHRGTR